MVFNLRSGPILAVLIRSRALTTSPCPPECNFQSETKIEPDLRLPGFLPFSLVSLTELYSFRVV